MQPVPIAIDDNHDRLDQQGVLPTNFIPIPTFIDTECFDWLQGYRRYDNLPNIKELARNPDKVILRALHDRDRSHDHEWVGQGFLSLNINNFHIFDHPCVWDEPEHDPNDDWLEMSGSPGKLAIKRGIPPKSIVTARKKGRRDIFQTDEIRFILKKTSSYSPQQYYEVALNEYSLGPNSEGLHLKVGGWSMTFHSQKDAVSCVLFHRAFAATLESLMNFNPSHVSKEYHLKCLNDAGLSEAELEQYKCFAASIDADLTSLTKMYEHMTHYGTNISSLPYDLRMQYLPRLVAGKNHSRFHTSGGWQHNLTSYSPQQTTCDFCIKDLLNIWCQSTRHSEVTVTRNVKGSGGIITNVKKVTFLGTDLVRSFWYAWVPDVWPTPYPSMIMCILYGENPLSYFLAASSKH